MKAVLCRGLYEPGLRLPHKAERIVAQCLQLCDGSKDLLSAVLQEKFIAERSPFYWAVAGTRVRSPSLSYSSLHYSYALLWALLEAAGEISMEIQQDILDALYRTENNALYQAIQGKLSLVTGLPHPDMSSTVPVGKLGETTVTKLQGSPTKHQIDFHATQFFDGLLVNSEVTFRSFLANDSLWTLRAVSLPRPGAQSWHFELTEVRSKRVVDPMPLTTGKHQFQFFGKIYNFSRHVELSINPIDRRKFPPLTLSNTFGGTRTTVPYTMELEPQDVNLTTFHENDYIGTERSLSGSIYITDTAISQRVAFNQGLRP
ncbi:hypothetical protein DFP72DRAFT_915100 [Ephemerocybe angulata]|uniref:Uncharacterized protein n=1 Tax=Ephemerocybe angulata TaxID=980116 RepID=A0A8H6HM32_9AGAR|nr:hypothetical protein DFP72DRAFT_915100 [Tulosesus angulatus]